MLTLFGKSARYCDGLSRRGFLKIGGFAFGSAASLSLADVLRAEHVSGKKASQKAVINIFLGGGPPHQDMWDIKVDAPREIRGEFDPIRTNVPGIEIGECFPKIAAMMDKFVAIRTVVGNEGGHDAFQCYTGWGRRSIASVGGRPSIGAVLGKLYGPTDPGVPAAVALAEKTQHVPWSDPGTPGFLGAAYQAFKPQGEGTSDMRLNGMSLDRLQDRKALLGGLDLLKRDVDSTGMLRGMDAFSEAAFGVLTSSKLVDALDISKEDPKVRERYGDGKPYKFQYDGAPTCNEHLLIARRLVEVGVRCVTLSYGRWDSHGDNFNLVRDHGSKLDQAVSALVQDLDERGMLKDVTVVVWGEFGRTPRINPGAGRDHWPQVSCALLAGGGMRTGQVIGSTNRLGEYAKDRPVDVQEVVGTIYRNLGVDPMSVTLRDPTGRPQFLVDRRDPITELV
ncbi:DUF1501 domain-containing protein [Schlesneria paludicola]|uniref:DUF1501 domain-containing protein n=1 Tax=Schlesneria paludicola TaxID=360056 RepID=UPI00029AED6E|nr:DUF1501 domain-containing protein [Schlesneria paludicola]